MLRQIAVILVQMLSKCAPIVPVFLQCVDDVGFVVSAISNSEQVFFCQTVWHVVILT
jgi:hypothetical protein